MTLPNRRTYATQSSVVAAARLSPLSTLAPTAFSVPNPPPPSSVTFIDRDEIGQIHQIMLPVLQDCAPIQSEPSSSLNLRPCFTFSKQTADPFCSPHFQCPYLTLSDDDSVSYGSIDEDSEQIVSDLVDLFPDACDGLKLEATSMVALRPRFSCYEASSQFHSVQTKCI